MKQFPHLIINQNAIIHNIERIRSKVHSTVQLMGVVKADAYGLGARKIVQLFVSNQIDYLAVARLDEAKDLIDLRKEIPILIFEPLISVVDIDPRFEYTVSDISVLKNLIDTKKGISIQININTGMNRLGMSQRDLDIALDLIQESQIKLKGVYTHFALAHDTMDISCQDQIKQFEKIYSRLKPNYPDCLFHAANSAAIFNFPDSHFDMVRSGIAIYGSFPNAIKIDKWQVKPVCKLITQILQIKEVNADSYVGYSNTYQLKKDSKIAVIQIGYADGYNRNLSNNAQVVIANNVYSVIGLVSMDLVTIDIGNANLNIGDKVELISDDINSSISLESMAAKNQTIPYEILTSLSKRIKRIYIRKSYENG